MKQELNLLDGYTPTNDLLNDAKQIIEVSQKAAYRAVNLALVQRNWLLGYRIAQEELKGEGRSEYGTAVIRKLAKELTAEYGKGFDYSSLYKYFRFYKLYPEIVDSVSPQSGALLSWTHYRVLLQAGYQADKLEFIKNPMITEFLGLSGSTDFTESKLESCIITNIQKFLMELGKGYAFVARQQHIHTEKEDYYIDLVFYNYILKCFVLVDLKTSKITHQDVGQMDMYIRMYDELKRGEGDNPTIGIVLCSDTDEDIAKYSVLHGNEQLFASKYKLYLPTEEELRAEIEMQKEMFYLQQDRK